MVRFNELRISQDGKYLIIDVSVRDESYYDNIYIQNIKIDTQDTFTDASGASSEAIYNSDSWHTVGENAKNVRLTLESAELGGKDLNSTMFFVFVTCTGDLNMGSSENDCAIPCGMDNPVTLGTVVASYPYYQQAMSYIGDLSQTCIIPKDFIDFILRTKAMEVAVKTGNYQEAIKYFNKFFKDGSYNKEGGGCGCGSF